MVLAAPLVCADYDIEVLTTFGMQTQKAELQSISTYEGYSNFERFQDGYAELRGSLGLSSAEYFDIDHSEVDNNGRNVSSSCNRISSSSNKSRLSIDSQ